MCWAGRRKCNIAEEDITVYKYLDEDHNSPILNYHYRKNELCEKILLKPMSAYKKICIDWDKDVIDVYPYIFIYCGYHSYIKEPKKKPFYFPTNSTLYKFIIPKGSEYYINVKGEVVSNQIIFTGEKAK